MNATTGINNNLDFKSAFERLKHVVIKTPLQLNENLSRKYECNVFLKREDLQIVRSYKLRGAYNMISSLSKEQLQNGVVCASAGNHAQGFAYSCNKIKRKRFCVHACYHSQSKNYSQTKMFGDSNVEVKLIGDNFDECAAAAKQVHQRNTG